MNSCALFLASMLAWVAPAAAQTTQPKFAPYQALPVGSWPESATIGDFDGDGKNDVALSTSYDFDPANDFKVFVFRQDASVGLATPAQKLSTHGAYSDSMAAVAADLNGDGASDLTVCTSAGVDLYVQRNHRLHGPYLLATPAPVFEQSIVDANGDGRPDIFVNLFNHVRLLVNRGHGFQSVTVTTKTQEGIAVGDLNGDGLIDVAGYAGAKVHVIAQNPNGSWATGVGYDCVLGYWPSASGIAVGDVTGDGLADVVVTIGGNQPGALLNVFAQLPSGTLAAPIVYNAYDIPEPALIRDVNGDGRADFVTLHGGWLKAGVYYQNTSGSFLAETLYPVPYATHYTARGLDVGDISGDGLADIVAADYNSGLIVLRQLP